MSKKKRIADWMKLNNLTSDSLAVAVGYSHGAVSKWRQGRTFPSKHAQKIIVKRQHSRGWSPFPVVNI